MFRMTRLLQLVYVQDDKTVNVVLDGITNILSTAAKLGETDKVYTNIFPFLDMQ